MTKCVHIAFVLVALIEERIHYLDIPSCMNFDAGIKLCSSTVVACDENRRRCLLDASCPFGGCFGK